MAPAGPCNMKCNKKHDVRNSTPSFLLLPLHHPPHPASVNSRKDKSLRVMSQKFVMLFLVSNPRVVSLDVAAKILIGEEQGANQDKNKFKSE